MTTQIDKPVLPQEGQAAPEFTLPAHPSGKISLSDFKSKKNVILAFYPKDNTPGCTKEMCAFNEDLSKFESADTVVLGISCDNVESHAKFADQFSLKQTILADVGGTVGTAYGTVHSGKVNANRVLFVIDKTGTVRKVIEGMPKNEELLEFVANLKMIKAVIFDIDGTLVDSVDLHAQAWQEAFSHFGVSVTFQQARDQIGKGGDQLLPTFLSELQIKHFGEKLKAWRGEHFKKYYKQKVKPFPESNALLHKVKESGKKLAAGSSAKEEELEFYLGLLGAEHLFDVKTSADDAEKSKPHPDIFQAALAKLDMAPQNAIVVGDSPYDIEAARKAKIPGVGVLSGGFSREWLLEAGAVAIYSGPGDLFSHYETSPIEIGARLISDRKR